MKKQKNELTNLYITYLPYGVVALLSVMTIAWLAALLLPAPFRFDFFGVVAESGTGGSTVTVGLGFVIFCIVILPLIASIVMRRQSKSK